MKLVLAVIGIALLLGILAVLRRRGDTENVRPPPRRSVSDQTNLKFHAVSLKFTANACDAAKAMEGRRFLSNAAPRIPLENCDVLECKCRFVHHKDRRAGDDRRRGLVRGFSGDTGTFQKEKRTFRDRRSDEPDDYFK